ncbi:MAG: ABC transporter ATP-binding protein [Vicinamibacterales bacterium]
MASPVAIRTEGLRKVYPPPTRRRRPAIGPPMLAGEGGGPARQPGPSGDTIALDSLDFEVQPGELVGLLGPNGAGKSTTIGILTTRIRPTAGRAEVAGADVTRDPVGVRQRIGVVPQRPNPDRSLTAVENLRFHAAYFGIDRGAADRRARELMTKLGLGGREDAKADQLSGGQLQRLMIARALIHEPDVLFLDEPTVGLDPQARLALWEILRELHAQGRTIVMTTHYMEEADQLSDRVAIVDRGLLLAFDTPATLKTRAPGGTAVELQLDGDAAPALADVRAAEGITGAEATGQTLRVFTERGGDVIPGLIRIAEHHGRQIRDIRLFPPSLETLFISLTGRTIE